MVRSRWPVFVVFLVGVVALAVGVAVTGPAGNDVVYGQRLAVEASVSPGWGTVTAVTQEETDAVGLSLFVRGATLVVTPDTTGPLVVTDAVVTNGGSATDMTPVVSVLADVDRPDAGLPAVLAVELTETRSLGGFPTDGLTVDRLDGPVTVSIDVAAGDSSGVVEVRITPVPVTGDDLGIPGPADVPDQRLPRPAVGEAIPTQLADGRPVWVVGLDDDVAVLDARSPHDASGLVGWCGSLHAFIDSIGGDVFDATGGYRFGPAPHGMTPYAVQVADDHVIVTGRLAPPPRPDQVDSTEAPPAIEGSATPQAPPFCDIDRDLAQQANEDGYYLEDYRDSPSWVQHDLSGWPDLERARGDGWFRTDQAEVPGVARLEGDLLVLRERGQIVDLAAPPGTARFPFDSDVVGDIPDRALLVLSVDRNAATTIRGTQALWVTPDSLLQPASAPRPEGSLSLVRLPYSSFTLEVSRANAGGLTPGALVVSTRDEDGASRLRAIP